MFEEDMQTVSVIIPTLNAGADLDRLIKMLSAQTYSVSEIIVVDSESDDDVFITCQDYSFVQLIRIKREDFDHGKTRDMAFGRTKGSIVVFLTQDCLPADKHFIERLIEPLKNERIAVSTGRQLPKPDASEIEKLIRYYNYPAEECERSSKDISTYGIKTFFCSDVCAAYRRDLYYKIGGYDYPIKTNEDMFFAAKAIHAGYSIMYAANAQVFHSHNLSLLEQYKRNYIQGYEIERHRNILYGVSQNKEGIRFVKFVSGQLIKGKKYLSLIHFAFDCMARLLGSKMGMLKARFERKQTGN